MISASLKHKKIFSMVTVARTLEYVFFPKETNVYLKRIIPHMVYY